MKRALLLVVIMITTISLVSCYTYETVTDYKYESAEDDYNKTFRGVTRTQIIDALGAPTRIVPIEGASVILVYEKYLTSIDQPFDPLGLGIGSSEVRQTRIYEEYYIGNDSKCYNVKTNKINIIPYEKTIKKSFWESFFGY